MAHRMRKRFGATPAEALARRLRRRCAATHAHSGATESAAEALWRERPAEAL